MSADVHYDLAGLRVQRHQQLAAALSTAGDLHAIVAIMTEAGRSVFGAVSGGVFLLRDDGALELTWAEDDPLSSALTPYRTLPLTAPFPVCDAVRTAQPLLFESHAALLTGYPHLQSPTLFEARVVLPLVTASGSIGALVYAFDHARTFTDEDRERLSAMAGQASLALDRCRLVEAEHRARLDAEAARLRERELRLIAARLSSALTPPEVAAITSEQVIAALGAHSAAVAIQVGDVVCILGAAGSYDPEVRAQLSGLPISSDLPIAETIRTAELVWCASEAELAARYSSLEYAWRGPGLRAWGAIPFSFHGHTTGALALSFTVERALSAEDRELLLGIGQLAAQALERAQLYQTVRAQKEQLELAVEQAQLADRRKDEFLAMLGHELRNPLAPITTALELMDMKGGDALQGERAVIRRQVDHMSRLIDDLLDVSRITRGKIQLDRQPIEVGLVLAKAIEMASPLLEKRLQQLAIDVPRAGLLVDADPIRLAQVFQNLLTNASKYSEPESRLDLSARPSDDRILVEVRDRGMGIPAEVMPRLFDLFVQSERAIDRAQGGLGIGLTIAKSLCELHGGTITAASAGPGQGSTFTVALPRATAQPAAALAPAPSAAREGTGRRVLIVDDNVDAAEMLRDLIARAGHETAIAHDGVAALAVARGFQPDVAVLDIGLPVMDGYELARRLREQPRAAPLRLIAVTGYGQDSDRARAREAGFDHHLIKPIRIATLLPLLEAPRAP